jgi:Xaa-Pro dipeptidase
LIDYATNIDRSKLCQKDRINNLVNDSGLDAVIATSLENVTYLSGYYNPQMRVITDRLYIVVWPTHGEPFFIAPGFGFKNLLIKDIKGYDFYARNITEEDLWGRTAVDQSPIDLLSKELIKRKLVNGRIGIEKIHFPVERYEELKILMPTTEFVDCTSIFDETRMIKTEAEIELLKSAGIATEKAILGGFESTHMGDTSRSLAEKISSNLLQLGAERVAFIELEIMSGDKRYDYLHELKVLEPGDLVKVDAGGYFGGYYSDVARMAVVGPPNDEQKSTYDRLRKVHKKLCEKVIKPGFSGKQVLKEANNAFREFGFKPHPRSIAHGLGLYIHERPWVREAETYELKPNMVMCIETINVRESPNQMWHIEDLIVITDEGSKKLTTHSTTEEMYVIK